MNDHDPREGLDADRLYADGLPRPELLEQWGPPEAADDLVDRIVQRVEAPNLNFADGDSPQPLEPTMSNAAPDLSPSRHSFALPVAIGFAVAAGLLAAFWAGRATVSPPPVITVPAPATASPPVAAAPAITPAEPTTPVSPDVEPASPLKVVEEQVEADTAPAIDDAPARTRASRSRSDSRGSGSISADLKNPFGGRSDDAPAVDPTPKRDRKRPKSSSDSTPNGDLENPFGKGVDAPKTSGMKDPFSKDDSGKTAILRIGTAPGVPPANITIDGVAAGSTPRQRVMVRPGRHKVTFMWPDGRKTSIAVDAVAGEARTIRAN